MLSYDEMVRALRGHTPSGTVNERSQLVCPCGEFFGFEESGEPQGWAQHIADVVTGDIP